ncbi:MAG: leucyl/phenylalanyl-tRNA--protein transferase [FCB group bacterium]|jgi:leucyl/phenylalanyl-tRNA--protein transferase
MLDPDMLLDAYKSTYFPMAEPDTGEIFWYSPDPRAVFDLYELQPPRSLRKILNKNIFEFRINSAFVEVIEACGKREDTWISNEIIESYINLYELGFAHSVEAYYEGELAGGLYGVSIGGAFFGESMFYRVSNASKAAFFHLVARLIEREFILLDTQFLCEHTKELGAIEISKGSYMEILEQAIALPRRFVD